MKYLNLILLLIVLFPEWGKAQTQEQCGYVLYKEDFGGGTSSPEMGSPLPKTVTTYRYTTEIPINDGEYGIRKGITGHESSWVHGPDHTGNGYMMLINADYDPGKFYEKKITGLCQGSSFYFSAWIANIMKKTATGPLDPNIRFEIRNASDSSLVTEFETGLLPRYSKLTWEQYGVHFDLPDGENAIILRIFNNQGGGNGNDLVLDDITFSLCGPPLEVNTSGQRQNVCRGDQVVFKSAVKGGYKNPQYQWQFSEDTINWQNIEGATMPLYQIGAAGSSDSGWYRILVAKKGDITLKNCRISSNAFPLKVWSPQPFTIAANDPVCEGRVLQLKAPEALKYEWQGPNNFKSDKQNLKLESVTASQQGTYTLTETTEGGCTSQASKTVKVQPNGLFVSLGEDRILCEGTTINLNAANANASYQWNTGTQTPSITIQKGGFYKVVVSKGICSASDSVLITEIPLPVVNLGRDTAVCIGEPYTLDATFKYAKRYLWQDGLTTPTHPVIRSGNYTVTVSNECGIASDDIHIEKVPCADHLLFPTAFTPNQDGQNDTFRPKLLLNVTHYELKIFDRWGRMVFLSKDPVQGWDGTFNGKTLPIGSYIWIVHYARNQDDQPVSQKGSVMLLH